MNRRIRNRMYGGVGGRQGKPCLLPDPPACNRPPQIQMKPLTWQDLSLLPSHAQAEWAVWERGQSKTVSKQELVRRLKRWQPQSVVLVGEPQAQRFAVPVTITAVSTIAQESTKRRLRNAVIVCSVLAAMLMLVRSFQEAGSPLLWSYSFASLALIFGVDLVGPMRSVSGIDERVRFLYWLKVSASARWGAFFWSTLGIAVGVSQYSLVRVEGIEVVFESYGFMYERFGEGEYWRALTGSYLHYSLMHYVPNLFLLILIGMVAFPTMGPITSVGTFLLGNMAGLVTQIYFGGSLYDSSGGMSFGIYALFGVVVMSAILQRRLMPQGFNILCALIAILALAISEVTSPTAATAGHITGVIVGMLVAVACNVLRILKRSEAQNR